MNIHQNKDNRVIIELSKDDMTTYQLDYNELNYNDEKTRELLNDLIFLAELQLNRDFSEFNKLAVDVLPEDGGGCIILLTLKNSAKSAKTNLKHSSGGLLCELFSPQAIFPLAENLSPKKNKIINSRLYLIDGKRYAAFVKPYFLNFDEMYGFLSEYGNVHLTSSASCAYLSEHSKLLSDDFISSLTS